FSDTFGIANQAETETLTLATTSSSLSSPPSGGQVSQTDFNSRSWVDVTFTNADPDSILDDQAEFTLTSSSGSTIVLVGNPVRLGNTDVYRYFFVGYTAGTLSFAWATNGWTDRGGVNHGGSGAGVTNG